MALETRVLLEGFTFGEGPRWHDGKLWFSDMYAHRVMTVSLDGKAETVLEVPGRPSGLGWLPDGRLLVVSMTDSRILRLDPEGLTEVADLSGLASYHCNDMVVDKHARAYIGNFGFNVQEKRPLKTAEIIMVTPDGNARIVADEMVFPNGTVITPDGRKLIVAETFGARLTAFNIEPDGSLKGQQVWAQLGKVQAGPSSETEPAGPAAVNVLPDGICLDAEGAIWVASPFMQEVIRVREGGEVTQRIKASTWTIACMLGGPDRRTLFVLTAETTDPDEARAKASARVEIAEVEVPGAGLP
jgi:sugar lactone lactonase YvrE